MGFEPPSAIRSWRSWAPSAESATWLERNRIFPGSTLSHPSMLALSMLRPPLWRAALPDRDDRTQPQAGCDRRSFEEFVTRFATVADLNRDFIIRPCMPEELLLRAYRVLRFVETAEVALQTSTRNGTRRVLVADDDATTIVMISTILKHFNFECASRAMANRHSISPARRNPPSCLWTCRCHTWMASRRDRAARRCCHQKYAGDHGQRASRRS